MSEETKIQWASSTGNPWIGCTKVSPGCLNCYAAQQDERRFSKTLGEATKENPISHWGKGAPRFRTKGFWKDAIKWNAEAEAALRGWEAAGELEASLGLPIKKEIAQYGMVKPERPRVFPSLCDWLDEEVPIQWLADFLKVIHDTPHLDWLLLTKRPENFVARLCDAHRVLEKTMKDLPLSSFIVDWLGGTAPQNVWFGVSAENQEWLARRRKHFLTIAAKVHFLSCEPLLGPIDLKLPQIESESGYYHSDECGSFCEFACGGYEIEGGIDWVIVGGESGDGARPCSVEWIWDIQMQCKAAGVACFVKQLGAFAVTENANIFDWPEAVQFHAWNGTGAASARIGLKHPKGGDSKEWPEELRIMQYPTVAK